MDSSSNNRIRSSTRNRPGPKGNKTPKNKVSKHNIRNIDVEVEEEDVIDPFEELMKEHHNAHTEEEDIYTQLTHENCNNIEVDDDIPTMLIDRAAKYNSSVEGKKKSATSNTGSLMEMRMGFGNLNLISSSQDPGSTSNLLGLYEGTGSKESSVHFNNSQVISYGSTSADLRAAIVSNWLTDHYEPQENISLPRSVLYDHYLEFCQSQQSEPVNSATFGKIIRSVFPTLRTRRLGTRGNSKYHYFGIGLKSDLLGNEEYSSIYAQYARPPPVRPRTSRRSQGSSSTATDFAFTNGSGAFSSYSTGAAASQVYSAGTIDSFSTKKAAGRRNKSASRRSGSKRINRELNEDGLDDGSTEALLLGIGQPTSSISGSTSFHQNMIHNNNNNMSSAHTTTGFRSLTSPNYDDFSHFLEQICTPVYSNVPSHISFENVQAFSLVYQQHIIDLLRAISSHEFSVVEGLSEMFWMNFPTEMLGCLHCDESLRIVAIADDYLYQVLIHTLIPDVLEPAPIAITQSIRQFSKFLEGILQRTLQSPIPSAIIDIKLDSARRFCQVLRRRTSLSHLTQALRSILSNQEHTQQMLSDWTQVDFNGIKEQCDWILKVKKESSLLQWIELSFRQYLQENVSLHAWASWIESILDQCILDDQTQSSQLADFNIEDACALISLKWTYYSSMIMRDLTLRSASSFGSFHLLNLLFSEYLMFSIEKRLDDHRRSVGLLSFWPTTINTELDNSNGNMGISHSHQQQQQQQQSSSNINITYSNPTTATNHLHNHFAFDDFFRKSAVLGPTSSPVATGHSNINAAINGNNMASSRLYKTGNVPVDKENHQVDYSM